MKRLGYFVVCAMLTMGICAAQDLVNISPRNDQESG
jgi:hypothetical protein